MLVIEICTQPLVLHTVQRHPALCVCVRVCAHINAHVCLCMWRPEVNLGYCPSEAAALFFEHLSLAWGQ